MNIVGIKLEKNSNYLYIFSTKLLYILFVAFIASTVIFTRESNVLYGNILDLLFLSTFFLTELLNPKKEYYVNSVILLYLLFLCFAFFSVFWSVDPFFTKFTSKRILFVLINMIVIYNILKLYDYYTAIFIGLMIGILYNVLLANGIISVSYDIYGSAAGIESIRFSGSTFQPNMLGGIALFTIMGAILMIYNTKNRLLISLYLLVILASYYLMILAISRASMVLSTLLVLVLFLYLFSIKEYKKYTITFIVILLFILIYFVKLDDLSDLLSSVYDRLSGLFSSETSHKDASTLERMKLFHMAFEIYKEHPFLGTGLDTMRVLLFEGLYSHNNYIELLASLGPIGFILYYSIHFVVIKKIFQIEDFWLKLFLLSFMAIILLFDMAGVNYYSKYVLFYMLLFSYLAEKNAKKERENEHSIKNYSIKDKEYL